MKTTLRNNTLAGLTLALMTWLVGMPSASAVITTFQSGVGSAYAGLTDTYTEYQSGYQNYNWGGYNKSLIYNNGGGSEKVALLNFALTSIAPSVSVNSATLSLTFAGLAERTGGFSQTYEAYAILRSGLNFGTGAPAIQNGTVSFSASSYDPTTPTGWGSSNTGTNGPVAGQDYSNILLGSFALTSANVNESVVSFSLNSSTVASWINTPLSNYGFVIVSVADALHDQAQFYSAQENQVYAPRLVIDTTAIPEPGTAALLGLGTVMMLQRFRRGRKIA